MPQEVEHDGSFDQDQLQTNLRFNEAAWCKITAIEARGEFTVSTHDNETIVPDDSLELKLDPEENVEGPEGSTLLCRGDAKIGGETVKVAVFRKAA